MWMEAYESKYSNGKTKLDRAFWDKLLGRVSAVTDTPSIDFGEELIAAYPEAKVILWQRDEEAWFQSYNETVINYYDHPMSKFLAWLEPGWYGRLYRLINRCILESRFGATSQEELRRNCRKVYRQYFVTIRECLQGQPERLL